jgi:hypothetical protein
VGKKSFKLDREMPRFDPKTTLFDPKIPLNLGIFSKKIYKKQYDSFGKYVFFTF